MVSDTISLPSPGYFSPLAHATSTLSVAKEYLALSGGPDRFTPGFTCPVLLGKFPGRTCSFAYRTITFCGSTFQRILLEHVFVTSCLFCIRSWGLPLPPTCSECSLLTHVRFRLIPVRSPLLRKSMSFSFPRGTEMFQFPRLSSAP